MGADVATYTWKYPEAIKPLGRHLAEQGIIGLFSADKQLRIIDDFFPVGDDGVKVGTRLKTEYDDLVVDDLVMLMRRGVDLTEVVHVTKVGDGAIPFIEESLDHAVGRHVDGTEDVLKDATTLFPTSDQVVWYTDKGSPIQYPGTSTLTREEMKEKLIQWADEAFEATQSGWATQSKKPTYSPPDAHLYGIDEIKVLINPETGVASVFPTKGPQVFMYYNEKWNPTI
ncbi:hypothetical protein L1S32_00195 [Methanogenium sp. S4BF]|uniref:hypothetical protein n=1 Tax=Methanogenium sp. S4BF TaxID=1789226 RepID=UPI002415F981|nr:hypothetical protein [Methanogenium sp. S4BF]WFN34577.1 hypothetical protein L1S32_00195 [Methanogenium sp. S4BF]